MKKHVCVFNRKCWCGAGETQEMHDRVRIAGVGGKAGYPFYSDSLGVHPSQVREEMEAYRQLGVPTELASNGTVKIENRAHHKAVMKVNKMHERSSVRMGGHVCA